MDEREGLPSASYVESLYLCPGSLRMSRGMASKVSNPQAAAWAESGDRVHLYCEAPDFIDLSAWPDELEVAQACLDQRDELLFNLFGHNREGLQEFKEARFWLTGPDGRNRFSGKLDYGAVLRLVGVVVDYKSNRGDITESASNLQIRAQAVLLWISRNRELEEIYTAIIQPLKGKLGKPVRYTKALLAESEKELEDILAAAEDPNAPVRASKKACQYCPAKLKCPAAVEVMEQVAEVELTTITGAGVTPDRLAQLLDLFAIIEPIIKAGKAHAKALLKEDPNAVPGWFLEENSPTREVTDPQGLFQAIFQADLMDQETFLKECVSVGIGDVEKAIYAKRKPADPKFTKKAATALVNEHCKDFISSKPKEPSLKKL